VNKNRGTVTYLAPEHMGRNLFGDAQENVLR